MKVNWATSPGNAPKQDTSSKFHPRYFFSFLSGEENSFTWNSFWNGSVSAIPFDVHFESEIFFLYCISWLVYCRHFFLIGFLVGLDFGVSCVSNRPLLYSERGRASGRREAQSGNSLTWRRLAFVVFVTATGCSSFFLFFFFFRLGTLGCYELSLSPKSFSFFFFF